MHASAQAQTAAGLTYRQALVELVTTHPLLAQKRSDIQAAGLGLTVAERQHWPTPSVSASSGPQIQAPGTTYNGDNKLITARLSVPVFTGGLLTAEQNMAAVRLRLAEVDLQQNALDVSFQFVDLYRQWWQYTKRVEVVHQTLGRLQLLREMMERRVIAGVSSEVDLQLTMVQINRMLNELSQVERSRDQALTDIGVLLGKRVSLQVASLTDLPTWNYGDVNELSTRVRKSNPSIEYAELQKELAQFDVERTKAGRWPTINLRVDRQWGAYYGSLPPGDRVSLDSQVSLGAGLSQKEQEQQAQARVDSAEHQVELSLQRTETQVSRLASEHEQAMVEFANTQALVLNYEDITSAQLRLFASGRRSWLDLLNIQREAHLVNVQLVDVQSTIVSGRIRMALLANTLSIER
jgi:adhesin transport system outer membrane protein